MSVAEHRRDQEAHAVVALMVTSNTRTMETDETGKLAVRLMEEAGHSVAAHIIVPNNVDEIREAFKGFLDEERIQVIITSGGTGIGVKDITVDTVSPLLDKRLEGFGELFRQLSFRDIGTAAMFSRATAGVAKGKLAFCLPGSRRAMETALEELILPSLGHMIWELKRS